MTQTFKRVLTLAPASPEQRAWNVIKNADRHDPIEIIQANRVIIAEIASHREKVAA